MASSLRTSQPRSPTNRGMQKQHRTTTKPPWANHPDVDRVSQAKLTSLTRARVAVGQPDRILSRCPDSCRIHSVETDSTKVVDAQGFGLSVEPRVWDGRDQDHRECADCRRREKDQ